MGPAPAGTTATLHHARVAVLQARHHQWYSRQAVPGKGSLWGGEERSPEVGACTRTLRSRPCKTLRTRMNASDSG